MAMVRNLIPWTQLTRLSIPPFQVCRRPLTVGEVIIPVGAAFDPTLFAPNVRGLRLRQFYEQRLLEPTIAPLGSRQAHRPNPLSSDGLTGELQSPGVPAPDSVRASSAPRSSSSSSSSSVAAAVSAAVIPSVEVPVYAPPRKVQSNSKGVR